MTANSWLVKAAWDCVKNGPLLYALSECCSFSSDALLDLFDRPVREVLHLKDILAAISVILIGKQPLI
jgi:hypothetical protein